MTDWPGQFSLPQTIIKGGLCVSGIYDLHPVRLSARNTYVRLDVRMEQELSPCRFVDRLACPLVVAYGEFESDEFKRQSRTFASLIEGAGLLTSLKKALSKESRVCRSQMPATIF
jgi:arylformamidase